MKIMKRTSGRSGTSSKPEGVPRGASTPDEKNRRNYLKNIEKYGISKTQWIRAGGPRTKPDGTSIQDSPQHGEYQI